MLDTTTTHVIAMTVVDGVSGVVHRAGEEAGWVAMMFALMVTAAISLLGWLVKQLWGDQRDLQRYIRETLTSLVANNQERMGDVTECLMRVEQQLAAVQEQRADCSRVIDHLKTR